jgi:hypothetical protein
MSVLLLIYVLCAGITTICFVYYGGQELEFSDAEDRFLFISFAIAFSPVWPLIAFGSLLYLLLRYAEEQ